jgi:DNA-binding GntR family transcriptional regulator
LGVNDMASGSERQLKTDLVERELLRMIDSGELRPGEVLQQRDIARRLEVSPTPVREAFRRLEAAGLIVSNSHSGARVAEPTVPTDPDALRVRAALEHVGIEMALQHATPEYVAELRRLNEAYAAAAVPEARELHRRLHFTIFEIAGSQILMTQIKLLWGMLEVGSLPRREQVDSAAHHGALIDAIAARDVELAKRLIDAHHNPSDLKG